MTPAPPDLPAPLRLPARLTTTLAHAGPEARAWATRLPALASDLCERWGLTVGDPYEGGAWSLVLPASGARATGGWPGECVLKLVLPDEYTAAQFRVLDEAAGRGCVRVLASDVDRGALLMERLRPGPAESWDTSPGLIAGALLKFWQATASLAVPPARHKAEGLLGLLDDLGHLAEPRHRPAVEAARELARGRLRFYRPDRLVCSHGDPHAGNLMVRDDGEPVLVDADGTGGCEPEYDLGVVLRSWTTELLAADDPRGMLRAKASELAQQTGCDAPAILAWAGIERVTTGLYLRRLGHDEEGCAYLDSALRTNVRPG
ncbi:phosphotransferase [Aestuariimicrobium sp. T2.26MG-19.2B]|uniref:phosphotransferase n=1 Tax=Aestuariimicrobium sp. T2.26MG-19.2B TaxID=3040679 RepID=UPI002477860D|nr:phosphotransferase [Aestuariimicrobium sp. T2.26MG-19.2B]CAI9400525.1 hypothetical protein AESSP_00406 [Aestuariimicrobium sp. T2.26MG-19.2B]